MSATYDELVMLGMAFPGAFEEWFTHQQVADSERDVALPKCRDRLTYHHLAEGYDRRSGVCRRCRLEAWFKLHPRT